ncbi:MAG TPA: hypothetical protein VEF72_00570, partial [Mycobacterium sp.]|nr:hypothetical protein [Mycobacterium sp.]
MTGRRFRWLGFGLLASAGAGLLALTSAMTPAVAFGDDTAWVMGGSGLPIPPASYVNAVDNLYITPASSSCWPGVVLPGLVAVAIAATYKGYRYPIEIIGHAVWLYHRFALSLRDVEELMLARGVVV